MKTPNTKFALLSALLVAISLQACGPDAELTIDEDNYAEDLGEDTGALTAVTDDDLNGIYQVTVNGAPLTTGDAVIESWTNIGIRLNFDGAVTQLTRSGDVLTGTGVSLTVKQGTSSGVNDDSLDGTINGQAVILKRDTRVKPPLVISFPGDRPFRSFLTEVLAPQAQRDRESYVTHSATKTGPWLRSCTLYKTGAWQRKYFKGATWSEQNTAAPPACLRPRRARARETVARTSCHRPRAPSRRDGRRNAARAPVSRSRHRPPTRPR